VNQEIYIFSGVGADNKVFQQLDLSGYSVSFINWQTPKQNESIENYANRLLDQIHSELPIFIGLSFGGLMAIEVAKQIEAEKVILISSAKTKSEIPFYYRIAGKLCLHRLLPLKYSNFITNWLFGATSKIEKDLLSQILIGTDPNFFKWAIDKIVNWKNTAKLKNIVHIHGTSDRLLPIRFVSCDYKIKDGGHLMLLNKAEEVNEILGLSKK
jgi:pimeloyl-ACP methyl ester carboxylesterase